MEFSLKINDLIFYKDGYYIISNINGKRLKIDDLFSSYDVSTYINYNDVNIQIPNESNKLYSFLKIAEKYNYNCIGTKINVNHFVIPEFEIFKRCKLTINQFYEIEKTGKKTKNKDLEIKNIIINPFLFITEEFQLFTYEKADFISREYRLHIKDETRLKAWSYCYFLKLNNSFYVLKTKYMKDIENFTKKQSIYLDKKLLQNIENTIIDKSINGKIYKTTLYLLNLERKITDDTIKSFYFNNENEIDDIQINKYIQEYENIQQKTLKNQFRLEIEQKEAIINAIQYNFSIIYGPPGTGKTEIIRCINYVFYKLYQENKSDKRISPKNISILAPTGFAYVNVRRKQQENYFNENISGTCHKVLYNILDKCKKHNCKYENNFCLLCDEEKEKCKYFNIPKLFIVDEFSMIDIFLFRDLLFECKYYNSKLIIIGDPNQLPSIGPGIILNQLINSELFPIVELNKIKRQEFGQLIKNILKMTTDIINLTDFTDNSMNMIPIRQFVFNDQINREEIINLINKNSLTKNNSKFISYFNDTKFLWNVVDLNKILQDIYNPLIDSCKYIPFSSKFKTDYTFRVKDKIVRCYNDYSDETKMRANGEEAIIEGFNDPEDIFSKEKVKICYSGDDKSEYIDVETLYENFKLNYCSTIHKSQGSQYKNVVFIIQPGQNRIDKKSIYTAISRAQEKCIIISHPNDFVSLQTNNNNNKVSLFLEESNDYDF
jgi:exodeoxyribonuclease V alpha subunit